MNAHKKKKVNYLSLLFRNFGINFMLSGIGLLIMFFFRTLTGRFFGPENLGIFAMLESIMGFVMLIVLWGIGEGVGRFLPHYRGTKDEPSLGGYLRYILGVPLLSSIGIAVIVWFSAPSLASFFNMGSLASEYIRALSLVIPIRVISRILRRMYFATNNAQVSSLSYQIIEKGTLLITVILAIWLELSFFWVVLGLFLSLSIPLVFELSCVGKYIQPLAKLLIEKRKREYHWKEWFMFSIPLLFSGFFTYVVAWSDTLILGRLMNTQQVGIYSAAMSLAALVYFFQMATTSVFTPIVARMHAEQNKEIISTLYKKALTWVLALSLPVLIVLLVYAQQVLQIFFGNAFTGGALALQIIALGYFANISCGLAYNILIVHKKTKTLFVINVIAAAANIILNIVLIPILGIMGAALASALSIGSREAIFLFIAQKHEKLPWDIVTHAKYIIAGILAIGIVFLIRPILLVLPLYIYFGAALLLFIAFYLILSLLFKAFTSEDIDIIYVVTEKLNIPIESLRKIKRKVMK